MACVCRVWWCGVRVTRRVRVSPALAAPRPRAAGDGFLDNRVVGGGPEDGWVGLTLNT